MGRTLVVLGMHRSGTSALTEVLVAAGAWFGAAELATSANEENPRGFFERRDVRQVTDQALAELRLSWHDLHNFEGWEARIANRLRKQFTETVVSDLNTHAISVVKDPRLCLMMPLFGPVLPDPVAVFITREPAEIAMSLHQRHRMPWTLGIALWEVYNRQALAAMAGMPWVRIRYEDLLRDPPKAVGGLVARLDSAGLKGLDLRKATRANTLIPGLHRQHATAAETRRILNGEQLELWKRLSAPELEPKPFTKVRLSRGAREALAWHHAACAAVGSLPYLRALNFPRAAARD